jgi:hypothetical protein
MKFWQGFFFTTQGFSFISALNTVAVSHITPESAATFRHNCSPRDDDKKSAVKKISRSPLAENSSRQGAHQLRSLPAPEAGSRAGFGKVVF